ncbi:hypothetical protein Pen01_59390 [Phytomonospora endophytica]|nr:hypothetical protein Pen01_59390 [Phytomonospora endophytica]
MLLRDGDDVVPAVAPLRADEVEGPAAEGEDVGGLVGELVADVLVAFAFHRGVVDAAPAVGVDEAAQEGLGVCGKDVALPVCEDDGALVLASPPVLREEAGPVPRVRLHDRAPASRHAARPVRQHGPHGLRALNEQVGIGGRAGDPQPWRVTDRGDVAVAEVQAEEIGVAHRIGREPGRIIAPKAGCAPGVSRIVRGEDLAAPVPDGGARKSVGASSFGYGRPARVHFTGLAAKLQRIHGTTIADRYDNS